jgi:hypothetical protein
MFMNRILHRLLTLWNGPVQNNTVPVRAMHRPVNRQPVKRERGAILTGPVMTNSPTAPQL